jgi:Tol biopolymer transport system component/tRNA A-37 threonylcarbamoyl transferase component Bud32
MELREQLQAKLGPAYALDREIEGGGMSRVLLARDTALRRDVVVKLLRPELLTGVSVERFKREIHLAATLQHPHIVPLLSAGDVEGLPFYTMPFVRGESLRARLTKAGELSVNETIHILRDIAAALAHAHAEGVVHRDIKPENVMLSGGVAVVTDFGVAKAVDVAAAEATDTKSGLTSVGIALGTPAYMSPEQASADPHVDHRADIYSFGCVAYEMLSGAAPFGNRPPQQVLAAHVSETPEPLAKRRPNTPAALAALVMKCLEKRPGDRPQSAEELLNALDAISTPSRGTAPIAARVVGVNAKRGQRLAVAGIGLLVGAGAIVVWSGGGTSTTLQIDATTPIAASAGIEIEPAISPDGKLVAFTAGDIAQRRVFVRQIAGGRPVVLSGELDGDHGWPRWSPDGSRIVFEAKGSAYVVPALGGSLKLVIDNGDGVVTPAWSPDGKQIAYADKNGIWLRPVEGGTPRQVVAGPVLHSLSWSPDGRTLAFVEGNRPQLENTSVTSIWVAPATGGARTQITDFRSLNWSPIWTPDGRSLLYVSSRDGTPDIFQQPLRDGRPRGSPVRLTTGLSARTITLSADGSRLAYDVVRRRTNIWVAPMSSRGATPMTSARQITSENWRPLGINISHDGKWLAFDADRAGNSDIYKVRLDGGEPIQLTSTPWNEYAPTWSPDNREIAFYSSRDGNRDIYVMTAEGGDGRPVTSGPRHDFVPDWSPDGQRLVFYGWMRRGSHVVYVATRAGNGRWSEPQAMTSEQSILSPKWSPDGKWIAYSADGRIELTPADGGPSRVVADLRGVGEVARACAWGGNSSVLYFNTANGTGRYSFWSVPAQGGAPRLLLRDDPAHRLGRWDFATDGKRLFFTLAADEGDIWVMQLKR